MRITVVKQTLRIELSARELKISTENHPRLRLANGDPSVKVTNQTAWLHSIATALNEIHESGLDDISDLMDRVIVRAVDSDMDDGALLHAPVQS